jgi:hypothetical protein
MSLVTPEFWEYVVNRIFDEPLVISAHPEFPSNTLQYNVGRISLSMVGPDGEFTFDGYHRIECPLLVLIGRRYESVDAITWREASPYNEDWGRLKSIVMTCDDQDDRILATVPRNVHLNTCGVELYPGYVSWVLNDHLRRPEIGRGGARNITPWNMPRM